ncbi:MAG: DUF5312 domain-containing protein [Spirochaetaceae bacterium]|nr:DUF5312 domain-containing protein [Spirochaetaceae bacterium]MCF7947998.1 DUF5312 domain-containing protein [Spirochaetia bacterium]MCF7952192.1 DUF5312 domain-containing protein [Spirochaetaceae bacterium]
MEEQTRFERLVKNLSKGERHELLDKLHTLSKPTISQEPLKIVEEETEVFNYNKAFQQLSWIEKLFLFIRVLLTSDTREELLEEMILTKLSKQLERNYNNIYTHSTVELGANFYWSVKKLQDKLNFLREPLRQALAAQKKDFFAFLVGWELPDIQDRLMSEVEPEHVAYEQSITDPYKIRKQIEFQLEDIFDSIDETRKNVLYNQVRNLHAFTSLVTFPFEKLLKVFEKRGSGKALSAYLFDVRPNLLELTQVLFSVRQPPSEGIMKILFLFYLQNSLENEENEEVERRLNNLLKQTEEAIGYLRYFHVHIPLLTLSRLVLRNIEYVPEKTGGGEDWFVLFKQFWYQRFDQKMRNYSETYKRDQLIDSAKEFLKKDTLPEVKYYNNFGIEYQLQPRYLKTLGLIRGFMDTIFISEMNSPLKLVLIDGEFYKEQNREEYNDAYNGLIWINDRLDGLELSLSSEGEFGRRVEAVNNEASTERQRKGKVQQLISSVDAQAEDLIGKTIAFVTQLKNVITGILYGDMGGRYDTLSNFGYIGRNENKNLQQKLSNINKKLEAFLEILSQLYDAEKRIEE